jgi:V8-like Glu-specific endopeptidase
MTQQEVDNQAQYPWQSVVYIESTFPDGYLSSGSGVMVGPNDVLTASHIVYNAQHGGQATNVTVTPAFDPSPLEAPFGTTPVSWLNYFTDFDPDGDGVLLAGNGAAGFGGSEHDVAVLGLNVPLGNYTNWMGLDPNFTSGFINVTGHPAIYGSNMMNDYGYVQQDTVDSFIYTSGLELHPGNSGGPLWYTADNGLPYVVGTVSSAFAAYDVSADYDTVSGWIAGNDFLISIA